MQNLSRVSLDTNKTTKFKASVHRGEVLAIGFDIFTIAGWLCTTPYARRVYQYDARDMNKPAKYRNMIGNLTFLPATSTNVKSSRLSL